MFRINVSKSWPGISGSTILASQQRARTATAHNKGTQERGVDNCALVRGTAVLVHPVPVYVAPLAIVVTRWKGGDASSLVQLSKVFTNKRHNFSIGVWSQRAGEI